MELHQLKQLAGLVRGLLAEHDVAIGHSQSLDLIAALPGLRNWPEVNAFPDRVAACELDIGASGKLAYRLKSKHGLQLSATELLVALNPPEARGPAGTAARIPKVWPSGPKPGVYVTRSKAAINALMDAYSEATDGEVLYAEPAGSHHDLSIDLGDQGLSSNGLERVPSGTLIVVGPLQLNQDSWDDNANKLWWSCVRAHSSDHRVAVLLDTPAPEQMFKDIELLVRAASADDESYETALAGVVGDDGKLAERVPFVRPADVRVLRPENEHRDVMVSAAAAVPEPAMALLKHALARRATGLIVIGTSWSEEHHGIDTITALLPMTESLGPVSRIKPRDRGTPAKDMMVPDPIKVLPFLPSIESAYAHGYRRMLIDGGYTDTEKLLKYRDVLFFTGTYGLEVHDVFFGACRRRFDQVGPLLQQLVAAVGFGRIEGKKGQHTVIDAYVPGEFTPPESVEFEELQEHFRANRRLRWEDDINKLLDSRLVTASEVEASVGRRLAVKDFLKERAKK